MKNNYFINIITYEKTVYFFIKRKSVAIAYDSSTYATIINDRLKFVPSCEIENSNKIVRQSLSVSKLQIIFCKALLEDWVSSGLVFSSNQKLVSEFLNAVQRKK